MPADLLNLAQQSPSIVLLVLGLYLFKVVVNDLRHDLQATRAGIERAVETLQEIKERLDKH